MCKKNCKKILEKKPFLTLAAHHLILYSQTISAPGIFSKLFLIIFATKKTMHAVPVEFLFFY